MELTIPYAKMELEVLDAQAAKVERIDVVTELTNLGLSQEGVARMEHLWDQKRVIDDQVFNVGRVFVIEILNFVRANPNMAIGVAVGASVGALAKLIPYLESLLAPVAVFFGAAAGTALGSQIDRGRSSNGIVFVVGEEMIEMAKHFYGLVAAIFNALQNELVPNREFSYIRAV